MLIAADAASQGLVIGFGAAIITMLGLLLAAVYRMLDGLKDQLKDAREDLRREISLSRDAANSNLTALTELARSLDRDIVAIKTRLEYERGSALPAEQAHRIVAPGALEREPSEGDVLR